MPRRQGAVQALELDCLQFFYRRMQKKAVDLVGKYE